MDSTETLSASPLLIVFCASILATHRRQIWKKSPIFQEFGDEWEERGLFCFVI